MDARSQSPPLTYSLLRSLFGSTHVHRPHSRRSCAIRNAGRAEEEPWASMRGGRQRIAKSTTETQTRDTQRIVPPVPDICGGVHVNHGAVACCSGFSATQGDEEGRSVSPSSPLRIRNFSTSVAKTPPLAPATPTKRQMRREKTRMLAARPRVRQEHEKGASRHCLPRRPPGSASRIFSGEGEGAQRTPTSLRGSLVRSHHYQQSRFGWHHGNGLALPATCR